MGRDDCPFLCCSEFGPTLVEIVARRSLRDDRVVFVLNSVKMFYTVCFNL